jgi:aminoglycoside phosphotransferase (APT) family kinase protein
MPTLCTKWPADPAFGDLFAELSPQVLPAALCRDGVPGAAGWSGCQILEALYDPGRQLRLAFALGGAQLSAARAWPDGAVFYLRHPVRRPMSRRGRVIRLGGLECELYRFPNDRRLRGLRRFAARAQAASIWQQWLDASGEPLQLQHASLRRSLLRYVPEQKWIIRLVARAAGPAGGETSKLAVVVRAGDPRGGPAMMARLEALRSATREADGAFRLPKPIAFDARLGLLAVRWVWGEDLLDLLKSGAEHDVLERVAQGLAVLHKAPVDDLAAAPPDVFMGQAERCAADLVAACPGNGAGLGELLAELQARRPEPPAAWATVHNDFHWKQLRGRPDRLTLLDFERCVRADPLVDVATFAAQLELLGERPDLDVSPETAGRWRSRFLEHWERAAGQAVDHEKLSWYGACALLVLARGRMRHLRPDWNRLAEHCVQRARDILADPASTCA